jgi:hypothetical protein
MIPALSGSKGLSEVRVAGAVASAVLERGWFSGQGPSLPLLLRHGRKSGAGVGVALGVGFASSPAGVGVAADPTRTLTVSVR